MAIYDFLDKFLKTTFKDNYTQSDLISEYKAKFPQFSKMDDKFLASQIAENAPSYSFLKDYSPDAPIDSAIVPKSLRGSIYDKKNPGAQADTAKETIDQIKSQYPEVKNADDVELAKYLEQKYPNKFQNLSQPLAASNTRKTISTTVKALTSFPSEVSSVVTNPLTKSAKSVVDAVDGIPMREQFAHVKANADAAENKLLTHLASYPDQGAVGVGADLATATVLTLNGVYQGITGDEFNIDPSTIEALKNRSIDPKVASYTGRVVGGLALLAGSSAIVRVLGIPGAIADALGANQVAARFLVPIATDSATFASAGAIQEGVKQAIDGKLEPGKLGRVIAENTAVGALFGGVSGASNGLYRVIGNAALGVGLTKAQGGSDTEAAINGAVFGAFAAFASPDMTREQQLGAYKGGRKIVGDVTRETAIKRGYSNGEADLVAKDVQSGFDSLMQKAGESGNISTPKIEGAVKELSAKIEERLLPKEKTGIAGPEVKPQGKSFEQTVQEMGQTPEQYKTASQSNADLTPMPKAFEGSINVGQSKIEGQGAFAAKEVQSGDVVAPAFVGGLRTPLGRYVNHSAEPNTIPEVQGDSVILKATQPIRAGDEITVDYKAATESGLNSIAGDTGQSAVGAQSVDTFEKTQSIQTLPQEEVKNFKLFEETRKVVKKYAERVGEKYLPKGTAGVFYPSTDNIRVQSMNNVSVAAHEVTHYIDKKFGIFSRLEYTNKADLRNELNKIYLEYYPGAKIDHDPKLKTVEGIATFFQKLIEQPTEIRSKYPVLFTAFFKQHGSMYHPIFSEFVRDMRRVVSTYQNLDPLQKVGARITEKFQQSEIKDSYLNFRDKFVQEVIDNVYPIEKLAREAGVERTAKDPSLWIRMNNNASQFVLNNLTEKKGLWTLSDGEFKKTADKNVGNLIEELRNAGVIDDFSHWLVARRQFFDYRRLDLLRREYGAMNNQYLLLTNELESLAKNIPVLKNRIEFTEGESKRLDKILKAFDQLERPLNELQQFTLDKDLQNFQDMKSAIISMREQLSRSKIDFKEIGKEVRLLKKTLDYLKEMIEKKAKILQRDAFDRNVIDSAYMDNEQRLQQYADIFDKINRQNLNMLREVGLITPDQFKTYSTNEGYASFKRDVYDDIIGGAADKLPEFSVGKTRISSTMSRKGSELTIINPLYSLVADHAEIIRKSMRQMVYNKLYDITKNFPNLFQRQELKVAVEKDSGRISYPQEKDPNIFIARDVEGKRIPVLVSKEIKNIIDELLGFHNIHIVERLFRAANRLFVKGTTGIYPLFAPTNFIVDQISASAQTRTKMIPIYSALGNLQKILFDSKSPESQFYQEYLALGGERQTLLKWQDMNPEDLFVAVNAEKKGIDKAVEHLSKGLDILSLPNQSTEVLTRATEYVRSRMQGNPQIVALEDAGRVSVPFHHIGRLGGGTIGQTAIRSIPFMNPGMQALAQYYRAVNGKDTRNRSLFVTLAVTAAMIGSAAYLMQSGTEDQKNLYKDLDPRELAMYLWFPHPDGKKLIKVRIPEQMGWLATMVNMSLANWELDARYGAGDIVNGGTAFLPDQFDVSDPGRMFFSALPQFVKPLIGVLTNTREFPKIRPLVSPGLQYQEPRHQFHENTSEFAKYIGDKLNVSPIKVDYLIEGYIGRTSRFVTGKTISNPFVRDWYFTAGRSLQDYYSIRESVKGELKSLESGLKIASPQEAQNLQIKASIINETERLLKVLKVYDKTAGAQQTDDEKRKLRRLILDRIDSLRG